MRWKWRFESPLDAGRALGQHSGFRVAIPSVPVRSPALRIFLVITALCPSAHIAGQVPDLYEAETEVADQSDKARAAALPGLLAQVLSRLALDPSEVAALSMDGALVRAPQLLQRWRYRREASGERGMNEYRQILIARFEPAAVDRLLADAGIAAWTGARPEPQVWLVIDDGSGPRLLTVADVATAMSLIEGARQRGFGLRFPTDSAQYASGERAAWYEDAAAADTLLGGADAQVQLLGRLRRVGDRWQMDWWVRESGVELSRVTRSGDSVNTLLALGGELIADTLLAQHRSLRLRGEPGDYAVRVYGVGSANDYARLRAYLGSLPLVRSVQPQAAAGDRLDLRLDLVSGVEALRALVRQGAVLRESDSEAGSDVAEFVLVR